MNGRRPLSNGMIAAERRRQIHNWVLEHGSVNVTELAGVLCVGPETIRRDLDELHREGKVIRSHGGAIAKEHDMVRPPYSQVRGEHMAEKSWIGQAALEFLPATGKVFFGAGSTVYQLAIRIPDGHPIHVITTSPEMGLFLVATKHLRVSLLGGDIRPDTLATDATLSSQATDMMLFDQAMVGVAGLDIRQGITAIDLGAAMLERKIIEHSSKAVALCDSSKIGSSSYAKVGPVSLLSVLITDQGIDPEVAEEIRAQGVEVVIVGSDRDEAIGEMSHN